MNHFHYNFSAPLDGVWTKIMIHVGRAIEARWFKCGFWILIWMNISTWPLQRCKKASNEKKLPLNTRKLWAHKRAWKFITAPNWELYDDVWTVGVTRNNDVSHNKIVKSIKALFMLFSQVSGKFFNGLRPISSLKAIKIKFNVCPLILFKLLRQTWPFLGNSCVGVTLSTSHFSHNLWFFRLRTAEREREEVKLSTKKSQSMRESFASRFTSNGRLLYYGKGV